MVPAHNMAIIPIKHSRSIRTGADKLEMIEFSPKVMNDKEVSIGRFCYPSKAPPEAVQLINFSNSPQWIQEGVVLGKRFGVQQVPNKSAAQTAEALDLDQSINKDLPRDVRMKLKNLLGRYSHYFSAHDNDLGSSKLIQHRIDIGNHPPVHQAPYPSAWNNGNGK